MIFAAIESFAASALRCNLEKEQKTKKNKNSVSVFGRNWAARNELSSPIA